MIPQMAAPWSECFLSMCIRNPCKFFKYDLSSVAEFISCGVRVILEIS